MRTIIKKRKYIKPKAQTRQAPDGAADMYTKNINYMLSSSSSSLLTSPPSNSDAVEGNSQAYHEYVYTNNQT